MADDARPDAGRGAAGGLKTSLQSLAATLMAIAHTRLALLSVELEAEKRRLLGVLAWGALGILLGGFGLVFLAVWLTVLWWDTHRLLALGSSALAFLAVAAVAAWRVRALLVASHEWLGGTLAELEADQRALAGAASAEATPRDREDV